MSAVVSVGVKVPIVKRSRNIWTPDKDAELLEYYKHGLRPTYIAEQMGRTIASVEGRYAKLKKKAKTND
jgi:hypothetical protein